MIVSNEVICKVSGPTFLRRMSCEIRIKYYTYLYRVKVIFSSMVFFYFCCSVPNKGSQIFYHEIRRGNYVDVSQ